MPSGATTIIKEAFTSSAFRTLLNAAFTTASLPTLPGSIRKHPRLIETATAFPVAYVSFVGPVRNRMLDRSGCASHEGQIAFHVVVPRVDETAIFSKCELIVDTVKDCVEDNLKSLFHRLHTVEMDPEGRVVSELELEYRDVSVTFRFIYLRMEKSAD